MSSSSGGVPTPADALRIMEAPLLRWLYARRRPNQSFKVAFDQVASTPDVATFVGPVLGPQREVRVAAANALAQAFQGTDPQAALVEAANLANALLADYNTRRDGGG